MLVCLSASHKHGQFSVLERIAVLAKDLGQRLMDETPKTAGVVVLSTCNRFEVYLDIEDRPSSIRTCRQIIASCCELDPELVASQIQVIRGEAVAGHLFAVAAGLESVVVGESEIAGQVKRALEYARERKTTSSQLERLFQRASQTSRGIKTHTEVGQLGKNLVSLALDLAASRIDDWSQLRVLLVGSGRYATASLAALRQAGVEQVVVYSPSGRGELFAQKHSLRSCNREDFITEIARADLVVSATVAQEPLIGPDQIQQARQLVQDSGEPLRPCPTVLVCPITGRKAVVGSGEPIGNRARRLVLIDLGLPRNIDEEVGQMERIDLINLETLRIHAPFEGIRADEAARQIVQRAVRKFVSVSKEQRATPGIVALREHVNQLLEAEINRQHDRKTHTPETEKALRRLAAAILHTPMVRSRQLARQGQTDSVSKALEALFNIT